MDQPAIKIVVDADEVIEAAKELSQLSFTLPESAQHIYREFLGHFLHLPPDLFVCTEVPTTSCTGDRIVRFSIGAPKLEILTAALTALKVGLELIHASPPDSNLPECTTVYEVLKYEY